MQQNSRNEDSSAASRLRDAPDHALRDDARLLFEALPCPLLVLLPDSAFTIVAASNAYLRASDRTRAEIIGASIFEVLSNEAAASDAAFARVLRKSLVTVLATQKPHRTDSVPYDRTDSDGHIEHRVWRAENTPVAGPDGELMFIALRIDDVSEHNRQSDQDHAFSAVAEAHAEANASRLDSENYRLITDMLPQMVWTATPDGHLDYNNLQFADFTGYPVEAAEDGMWVRFLHPDDLVSAQQAWRRCVSTGEPYETIFRVRSRFGDYRWMLARARAIHTPSGAVYKWIGTNTDIHEKVLAEQELVESNRRKDEFLAMLAHELRNPMVPIGAGAEMLSMIHSEDERVNQVTEMMLRQLKHVTGLVDNLLEVSRVTQGRILLEHRTVDLKMVVHDSTEQVRPFLEAHKHRLTTNLPKEDVCVCGDYNRLVQVLSNLLDNAAKYTPDGGLIDLSVELVPEDVVLRVEDNGIGMQPDLLSRAFDLFQQGERTPARTEGGLGLGLALVKSLVEQQRGTVTAASDGSGHGSALTIRLPRVKKAAAARRVPAQESPPPVHAARRRVLLVDDNVDVAESVGMVLEMLGHDVAVEHDAQSAIERAGKESFDSCILDIGLPGMDGYELARRLRTMPGTRRAVLVAHTGYGQKEDKRLSSEAGFTHHLVKPAAITDLERVLADTAAH